MLNAASLIWLPTLLALGLAIHWLGTRFMKAIVSSVRPLAIGEPEAFGYERSVYHTADRDMLKVVSLALAAGLCGWLGLGSGQSVFWWLAALLSAAAIGLDLWLWERVAGSANYVWFQRGLGGAVHQIAIDNIRDLAVDEEDASGLTLRNLVPGTQNVVCRLRLRLQDKRILALPHTDSRTGLARVEAVANHVRLRKQQSADQQTRSRADPSRQPDLPPLAAGAAVPESGLDRELTSELMRLKRKALAPDPKPPES